GGIGDGVCGVLGTCVLLPIPGSSLNSEFNFPVSPAREAPLVTPRYVLTTTASPARTVWMLRGENPDARAAILRDFKALWLAVTVPTPCVCSVWPETSGTNTEPPTAKAAPLTMT